MKVRELIERLQEFDGDLPVVLPGYEGGVNDISYTTQVELALNVNDEWYYGAHEVIYSEAEAKRHSEVVTALRLGGENHLAKEELNSEHTG